MGLEHTGEPELYSAQSGSMERDRIAELTTRRIDTRTPLPYLLGEARFAGLSFIVDERVLIPRSPVAELIIDRFEPWQNAAAVSSILEIGTGSGCIAIACALAFPGARVVATDISSDALDIARQNVERHAVGDRLQLVQTDHADNVAGGFDVIITNPPYVPNAEVEALPDEYLHEPELALASGSDGLDSARRILQDAPGLLNSGGILILEVGSQWQALEAAFPRLPFMWLEFDHGGIGVALLRKEDF